MSDKQNNNQSNCCEGSDCCQPQSTGFNKKRIWKTLLFTAVILSACGVAAYSLFWNKSNASSPSCCPSGTPSGTGVNTGIAGLDENMAGVSFAFVVFPKLGEQLPANILAALDSVKGAIGADSRGPRILTLYPDNPAYIVAINKYDINDYPAVLALGNNLAQVLAKADINKSQLVDLYRKSKLAATSCCPTGSAAK